MERKKEEILDFVNFDGPQYKKRNYYAQVSNLLSELEKEIRQDQGKITRHACAESIISLEYDCETPNGDDTIRTDIAHNVVMNTKAL